MLFDRMRSAFTRFSFTSDPFTNIQWAVVDSYPARFVDRQKSYGVTVHQTEVFEIESQHIVFLFQQCSEHVHVFPGKSSTDAQNHNTLCDCLAVDFAGHCKHPSGIASEIASMESKLLATCNRVK
jgi:hypothetical protein